jgi:hypothetical protein
VGGRLSDDVPAPTTGPGRVDLEPPAPLDDGGKVVELPAVAPAPGSRGPGGREFARRLAAAAIPTAVYLAVVLRNLTYGWDDFIQFGVTLRSGLGTELLTYDLFEHFGPANRLAHGLLVTHGGLDTRWAIAVAVPIFFAYCLALVDLARLLGAGWGRVALCLAVATVTPATASIGAMFDQYLHVSVPVAAAAVSAAAYIRWVRTRRLRHALTGSMAVLLACAVQERGVFLVLFLVLMRVLVIEGGVAPGRFMGRWLRTLARDAVFLAVPVLVAVATTLVVALAYAADTPRGAAADTAALVGRSWVEQFVPMLTGVYGLAGGSTGTALVILANAVVVAYLVWSVRRTVWNVRPWLLLLAWYGFMMTFLGFGRLGLGFPVDDVLPNLQYYVYGLPAVVVLIAALRWGPSERPDEVRPRRAPRLVLQVAGAAALAVLVVVSSLPAAERFRGFAPDYLAASVHDVSRADAEGVAVIAPTLVPDALVPSGFFPYNSGEFYLREIDPETVVDIDPRSPLFLDDSGDLTAGTADLLARVRPGRPESAVSARRATSTVEDGNLCLSADGDGRLSIPLPTEVEVPGGAAWVRLVATGDGEGTASGGNREAWSVGAEGPLTSDHGSASFLLPTARVFQVDLLDVRATRLCIESVELWALSAVGPDGCAWVGPFGELDAPRRAAPRPQCTEASRGPG